MLATDSPAPTSRQLSTRLVARQVSELLLGRSRRGLALVPQERLAGFVFEVVLGAGIAHQPYRDPATGRWIGVEDARTLGRPVNATAIAHSMRLPLTTVRRRAAELVGSGLLIRGDAGFSVAPAFFEGDILPRLAAEDAAYLRETLQTLAEAGYAPAVTALDAGVAALPPGVVERLVLAFSLRALETLTELYGDVTGGTIVAAITALNVRRVTRDPRLSQLYSGEDVPPPDALREPVSLRALAGRSICRSKRCAAASSRWSPAMSWPGRKAGCSCRPGCCSTTGTSPTIAGSPCISTRCSPRWRHWRRSFPADPFWRAARLPAPLPANYLKHGINAACPGGCRVVALRCSRAAGFACRDHADG